MTMKPVSNCCDSPPLDRDAPPDFCSTCKDHATFTDSEIYQTWPECRVDGVVDHCSEMIYDEGWICKEHYSSEIHEYECSDCGMFEAMGIPSTCPKGHTDIQHASQWVQDEIQKLQAEDRKVHAEMTEAMRQIFNFEYYTQHKEAV